MSAEKQDDFNPGKFLESLTRSCGVYRMLDGRGAILYVGKAKNLRRRVASYFGSRSHQPRIHKLMNRTRRVEVTVTETEQEALLLECNLIKRHKPRFNIYLRDDKSYPYIYATTRDPFPRFAFHRGARRGKGRYLGPYSNAAAVRSALGQAQKLFRIRLCEDSYFRYRERPCLQYQLDRCTAPCVGLVSEEEYAADASQALLFLEGKNEAVLEDLLGRMERAAEDLDYERAALLRDRVAALQRIQASQSVAGGAARDLDVVAVAESGGVFCVAVLWIRRGTLTGSRLFFPRVVPGAESDEVLGAFISQHYFERGAPREVITGGPVSRRGLLEGALGMQSGHRVAVRWNVRGWRRRWVELARRNAEAGALQQAAGARGLASQLKALARELRLMRPPDRIECFDISHTGGESPVASCVVFSPEGASRSEYRRFNIRGAESGDDYGAIAEAVRRRYGRLVREESPLPELLLIDGGRGQLNAARAELETLGLSSMPVAAVAKGFGRREGRERIYMPDFARPLIPGSGSAALKLIARIRDEAHRFALEGHRRRRRGARKSSVLEEVPGLGPKRRRQLLRHFGGLRGVEAAPVEDLRKLPGIGPELAQRIYGALH
ncbi:MAG: excinuclease ABC subunit UvrC [Chromatiales bacterium]|nr:excinuclease ABC subunit UvrC [Chromatiales bacterium]